MSQSRFPALLVLVAAAVSPGGAGAQSTVSLELGGSQIGPALGSDMDGARYWIGGLRSSTFVGAGTVLSASFLGGHVLGDSVGHFLSGLLEATVTDRWSERWSGSVDVRLFGYGVENPFPYRTYAAELGQRARYRTRSTSLELGVFAGLGHSSIELWRVPGGETRVFDEGLSRVGATGELLLGSGAVQAGLATSVHRSSGDLYASLGARLVVGGSWGALELRADRWETPIGLETTGGLAFVLPLGRGWSFRGFVGRSEPDPLTLTQPGSGSGGALLGWDLYASSPAGSSRSALYEILEPRPETSRIRVTARGVPDEASAVVVLGDFTLWEGVEMTRRGELWLVEIDIPPGTHHFGFLVDGEWYVPDDAPDVVTDEWGRPTATLVIEGAGS